MKKPSTAELQDMARTIFGHELGQEEAEACRDRLIAAVASVTLLDQWEARLRDVEPAAVFRVPTAKEEGLD